MEDSEELFKAMDIELHGVLTRESYKKAFEDTLDSLNSQETWTEEEILEREVK